LTEQPGDRPEPVFSFLGRRDMHPTQLPCWITHTNERTHEIIRGALDRSPMFTGVIQGVGPRYCPSIEDKIHRFAAKTSHQIFLEPESLSTQELYPNGISTSLPFDVQLELVQSIRGLENAHLVRPGYATEYRLQLREDNADLRLTETGRRLGLIDGVRWEAFNRKRDAIHRETERLSRTFVSTSSHQKARAIEVLRRPEVTYASLVPDTGLA